MLVDVHTGIYIAPSKPRCTTIGASISLPQSLNPEEAQDRKLLARIARRESRAFEALYDRYGRPVYSLALAMLRDVGAAQEVAQEVFLSIWAQAAGFDPARGNARSWVLALAHHKSVDAVRRGRLRSAEPLDEMTASNPDVVDEALRRVDGVRVREALMRLPVEHRQAIVLAYYGGYTHQEVARRLAIPLGTAKTRIRGGMLRLRDILAGTEEVAP